MNEIKNDIGDGYNKIVNKDTSKIGLDKDGERVLECKYDSIYKFPKSSIIVAQEYINDNPKYSIHNTINQTKVSPDKKVVGVCSNTIIVMNESKDVYNLLYVHNEFVKQDENDFKSVLPIPEKESLLLIQAMDNRYGIINPETKEYDLKPVFDEVKYIESKSQENIYAVNYNGMYGIAKTGNTIVIQAIHTTEKQAIDKYKESIEPKKKQNVETKKTKTKGR